MISIEQALELVLKHAAPLEPRKVELSEALGCVLAADVHADRDYPPFNKAMMDGYAVCAGDAGARVPVAGEVAAGGSPDVPVSRGRAVRIMTGAPCPEGSEAVVPVEDTTEAEGQVTLPDAIQPGRHIALRGCDRKQGDRIASAGEVITPVGIAALASVGAHQVLVIPTPSVAVISTGSELVEKGEDPGPYSIRDCNRPQLEVLVQSAGFTLHSACLADDRSESLTAAMKAAFTADIVLLTGGVSAGKYDLVPETAESLGVERVFHKVRQKPGKPLYFGVRDATVVRDESGAGPAGNGTDCRTLFFGLPGNPMAVHLGFHRYVLPAGRRLAGRQPWNRECEGRLTGPYRQKGNRHGFVQALVEQGEDGGYQVSVLQSSGSADVFNAFPANAMVSVPADGRRYEEGDRVNFFWLGSEEEMAR